jgi:hypothetical protein
LQASRHVVQQDDRLGALVGFDRADSGFGLEHGNAQQAERQDHDRDQHFNHCDAALAAHGWS